MRKQLMTGVAAAAICLGLASCSRFDYTLISEGEQAYVNYENAFIEKFGEPAPDQTWGFGGSSTKATRSITNPAVAEASQPYTETWVTNYLATATEVNSTNATDNYDNGTNVSVQWNINSDGKLKYITDNYSNYTYDWFSFTKATKEEFEWYGKNIKPLFDNCGWNWNYNSDTSLAQKILDKLSEYNGDYNYWGITITRESGWVADPTFVRNFKITGTWDGSINVVATEGYTDGVKNGYERTVVVTGTWNLTAEQRVGSLGRIIVANGGKINLAAGSNLNSVNGAQIVVLPGGEITGEGTVAFNNGTSTELLSYNGGTIDVGKFNNNGGDFYNYGTLKAGTMDGGAGNSHYYNHGIVNIGQTGSSANLRLYNACQFYCSGNMRIRNYEGIGGSSLICDGELMLSSSEDGTSEPTYVGLAAGALVRCGTLNNNGTTWTGPTSGYAVLDVIDKFTYLNNNVGDFSNNIYLCAGTWDNIVGGNRNCTAKQAFWGLKEQYYEIIGIINSSTVKIVGKTTNEKDELIPTSEDFQVGVKGCTPGFRGKPEPETIRIIAEDLSASEGSDFDFNDVVFDVQLNWPSEGRHTITLQAAGGKLPLCIGVLDDDYEVHKLFGVSLNTMVNTEDWTAHKDPVPFIIDGQYGSGNIVDLPIWVQKGSDWVQLTAPKGKAASKIAVSTDYKWVKELQDISKAYKNFDTYVTSGKPAEWWKDNKDDSLIYNAQ
ncbi:MAG: hypothetical protein MR724_08565 [Prevotella sp.]|nr:hypothetical protein [Prevotella sp.]